MPEIRLSAPDITQLEIDAVLEVLHTPQLSLGPKIPEFENAFKRHLGVEHAVAVSSGTAGLHCCLLGLGIGPGDEVITTPFSFIASSNVILMVGAKPVFVDIDSKTLNINADKIEAAITPKTKAILAVEAFGNPGDFDKIVQIAARHEIPLVEDSCEALGSSHGGRKAGTFGRCGVFGFYPNKQMTTGEGGMVVTNDKHLADMCRSYRNQGRDPQAGAAGNGAGWLGHVRLGYNYRMSDINAALGIAQMSRLEEILEKRQRVAHEYVQRLMDHPHIVLPTIHEKTVMSWFVFVIRLSEVFNADDRQAILTYLRNHGIGCSNYFPPIHLQPFYKETLGTKEGDYPVTEYVAARTIALPFHANLTPMEQDRVMHHLNEAVGLRLSEK